ncbi:MAG: AMP-dependent synthetase and ligase [Myxococcales bacterium]|nr:AMP-dependent synthetase and ligase [Myxococcales bacterium]
MNHLADWTAYWARRTPEATALHEPLSGRRWSYWHLDRRANRLARALSGALGVGRGDRVAVLAHNRGEHFEALFACAKLGAMFAPLNWRLAAAELDAVITDAQPQVLLYDRACAELAAAISAPVPHRVAYDEASAGGRAYEQLLAAGADSAPDPIDVDLEDPVVLCYSSGTTGRPKGVLMSHRQLVFNSLSTHLAIQLNPTDSALVFMPLFHTGGLNCLATPLLHNGGRVVIMPSFDAERSLQLAAEERITLHMGVPTIFQMWRDAESFSRVDLSSARTILCGGAPCPLPLIDAYRERGVLFRQGYGLTEVGPNCFSLTPEDAFRKSGSVGWPNFYVSTKIVDDAGQPVAPGEVGELALGGPMVTLGYFRNADASAQAFRGTKWFHTGDLVRRDDEGYHYIVDRKKDMFISGGENVYPAEVELALAAVDGVAESCVIAVPDSRWGEVGRAIVVAAPGAALEAGQVLQHLVARLARYKIPKSVVFTDALPRNSTGKVLRQRVRERFGA